MTTTDRAAQAAEPADAGRAERRRGWIAAAAVWASTFVLYAATIDDHASLGDSPESIAGVDVWGVLHAPGYPAYVIGARVFSLLVPVGSIAFRVALFSAFVSSLTATLVYAVARLGGAARSAAAVGAAVFATGTSVWFYAGYEKHNAFTGFLVAAVVVGVLTFVTRSRPWALVAAAVAGGGLVGTSWQMAIIVLPVVLVSLALSSAWREHLRTLVASVVVATVVAAGCYGFVLLRAAAEPPINWGRASTIERLRHLITMKDFAFVAELTETGDGADGSRSGPSLGFLGKLGRYGVALTRETGVVALALAVVGVVGAIRARRTWIVGTTIATLFVVNVLATALAVGIGRRPGFTSLLIQGGFLVGALFATGVGVALGTQLAAGFVVRRLTPAPLRRGRRRNTAVERSPIATWAIVGLGVVMVIPALVVHSRQLERRAPDYARQYAANVFASLPDDAVLLVWGAERTFPLESAQVLADARPDVDVVIADALYEPWYAEDVSERLGEPLPERTPSQPIGDYVAEVSQSVREERPVYVEVASAQILREDIGYVAHGLVAEVLPDEAQAQPIDDVEAVEALVGSYDLADVYDSPFRSSWPNALVNHGYARMHLELARAHIERQDLLAAEHHLEQALRIEPDDEQSQQNLQFVREDLRNR